MITSFSCYRGDHTEENRGEITAEVYRHRIGDRMASDYYIQFRPYPGEPFSVPFRQIKSFVEHMSEQGLWR